MAALCSHLDLIRDARLTLAEVPLADLSFAFRAVPRCDAQWTGDLLALHGEAGTVLYPQCAAVPLGVAAGINKGCVSKAEPRPADQSRGV